MRSIPRILQVGDIFRAERAMIPHVSLVHYMHSPVDDKSPRLPQTISHRGYKGKFPENTLRAIEGAIQAGTHALELDLRLSRDGVVVLSHVSKAYSHQ